MAHSLDFSIFCLSLISVFLLMATRAAVSKTCLRPSLVEAEHSTYALHSISSAASSPCRELELLMDVNDIWKGNCTNDGCYKDCYNDDCYNKDRYNNDCYNND